MNVILNTKSKTALPIFFASNGPRGVTLLPQLSNNNSKLQQHADPYWNIAEKIAKAVLLFVFTIAWDINEIL